MTMTYIWKVEQVWVSEGKRLAKTWTSGSAFGVFACAEDVEANDNVLIDEKNVLRLTNSCKLLKLNPLLGKNVLAKLNGEIDFIQKQLTGIENFHTAKEVTTYVFLNYVKHTLEEVTIVPCKETKRYWRWNIECGNQGLKSFQWYVDDNGVKTNGEISNEWKEAKRRIKREKEWVEE